MTTNHTPGPWKFTFENIDPNWAIVTDAGGGIVANVNSETGPDAISAPATRKMPADANARLIAAAPDLLAALNSLLSAGTLHSNGEGLITFSGDLREYQNAHASARAAIAKARGE